VVEDGRADVVAAPQLLGQALADVAAVEHELGALVDALVDPAQHEPLVGAEEEVLVAVAELATAVVDGLAIQELIDDSVDRERAYAVLEFMLQRSLPELLESGLPAAAARR